jgi:UDP-glucose 4-epimerase
VPGSSAHTCKELAAHGFLPIAFENLSRGHRDAVQWGPFVKGVILPDDLHRVFEQYQPKSVIHFAALAYVGESVKQPLAYYRNNVSGLIKRWSGTGAIPSYFQVHARLMVFHASCRLLRGRRSSRSARWAFQINVRADSEEPCNCEQFSCCTLAVFQRLRPRS